MLKYNIKVITRMMIYKGQSIQGCCGKITTEYFIFSAIPKDGGTPESIVVGRDCGRQFLKLIEQKLPPMFSALPKNTKENKKQAGDRETATTEIAQSTQLYEIDRYVDQLTPLNLEYYNAIHLLVSSWGGVCTGVLSTMLAYLKENPERDTHINWLKKLNSIIHSDRRNRGLIAMAAGLRKDNPGMMYFEFPLLEKELKKHNTQLKL